MQGNSETVERIREVFADCLKDLLRCYTNEEPRFLSAPQSQSNSEITAIVGLGDEQLSASVAISSSLDSSQHLSSGALTDPRDWIGELSNQLAGRLKNRLGQFGVQPRLSTPTIVQGHEIRVSSPAVSHFSLWVNAGEAVLLTHLTLEVDPNLQLEAGAAIETMEEGALELF